MPGKLPGVNYARATHFKIHLDLPHHHQVFLLQGHPRGMANAKYDEVTCFSCPAGKYVGIRWAAHLERLQIQVPHHVQHVQLEQKHLLGLVGLPVCCIQQTAYDDSALTQRQSALTVFFGVNYRFRESKRAREITTTLLGI